MQLLPIFDTSVFLDLDGSKRRISTADWQLVEQKAPENGWPLSAITVFELLIGLAGCGHQSFAKAQNPLRIAQTISRGRVLEPPKAFIVKELFSEKNSGPVVAPHHLEKWLEIACLARTRDELIARLDLTPLDIHLGGYSNKHAVAKRQLLANVNPNWRKTRASAGASLPEATRNQLRDRFPLERWKSSLRKGFLSKRGVEPTELNLATFGPRVDAALTLRAELLRQTLLGSYEFDRNSNEDRDVEQLFYLARENNCFVTQDNRLVQLVQQSSQSNRIYSFESFLASLQFN